MRFSILFSILLFSACSNPSGSPSTAETQPVTDTVSATEDNDPGTDTPPETTEKNASAPPPIFEKEFSAGQVTFQVRSGNRGNSAANVIVNGLAGAQSSRAFEFDASATDAYLLDLNSDSFSELYLVLRSSGESLQLKGIASYRDRSAGEIVVKDSRTYRHSGLDRVFVEDGKLYGVFENENRDSIRFRYRLEKGETSFNLRPEEVSN